MNTTSTHSPPPSTSHPLPNGGLSTPATPPEPSTSRHGLGNRHPSPSTSAAVPNYKLKATLLGHTKGLSAVKISPDGKWVATSSADGRILVYSLTDFSVYRCFEHSSVASKSPYGGVNDVTWSPDNQHVASASDNKTVKVFHLTSGNLERVFHGHTAYVFCLVFNPQGSILISGSSDETLRLWDVTNGKCLRIIPAHSDPISSVAMNGDGTILASASHDGLVRLWDLSTGQCIKSLSDDSNPPISSIRFTPNSKFLLASSLDSTIRLWSPFTEKAVKTYTGHINAKFNTPTSIIAPSSQQPSSATSTAYVASGSEDGRIFLWDLQSRKVVSSWSAHTDAVSGISSHGKWLVSGGLEKDLVAKVWVDVNALKR